MMIIVTRFFSVLLRGDHHLSALPAGRLDDRVTVVGFVGNPRLGFLTFHQRLGVRDVGLLAGAQEAFDRVAQGIDDNVDFAAETASGTAETRAGLPPFWPAAC